MIIKRHDSPRSLRPTYLLGHPGTREAILIDPGDDVKAYLAEAERYGLVIRNVFATDYGEKIPFGLLELREIPGVRIHQSDAAPFVYDATPMRPGEPVRVGRVQVVLVRDGRGAESFVIIDLEGGVGYLALSTCPLEMRRPEALDDRFLLADTA